MLCDCICFCMWSRRTCSFCSLCWQLSVTVSFSLSVSQQEKMTMRENRVETPPNHIISVRCVLCPASSSCFPTLILSCRRSRLVLPDPISPNATISPPPSPRDRRGEHSHCQPLSVTFMQPAALNLHIPSSPALGLLANHCVSSAAC